MGHKISPTSLRLQLTKNWSSRWFAAKADFASFIVEDEKIRTAIMKYYGSNAGISRIVIKRNPLEISLDILSSKPGILIGRGGKGINDLKLLLVKITNKKLHLNIIEIKKPDLHSSLVAAWVGNQITKRMPFRRVVRQAIDKVIQAGAKGVRITVSGRLQGAEIARRETSSSGSMPLGSISADVDYAIYHANTTYGIIGVKVWIYKGKLVENLDEISRPIF